MVWCDMGILKNKNTYDDYNSTYDEYGNTKNYIEKPKFYFTQSVISLIYTYLSWLNLIKNLHFRLGTPGGTGAAGINTQGASIMLIISAIIYVIITVIFIIVGTKKLEEWNKGLMVISIVISVVAIVIGYYAVLIRLVN